MPTPQDRMERRIRELESDLDQAHDDYAVLTEAYQAVLGANEQLASAILADADRCTQCPLRRSSPDSQQA